MVTWGAAPANLPVLNLSCGNVWRRRRFILIYRRRRFSRDKQFNSGRKETRSVAALFLFVRWFFRKGDWGAVAAVVGYRAMLANDLWGWVVCVCYPDIKIDGCTEDIKGVVFLEGPRMVTVLEHASGVVGFVGRSALMTNSISNYNEVITVFCCDAHNGDVQLINYFWGKFQNKGFFRFFPTFENSIGQNY